MSALNGLKTIGILGGMGAAASVDLYRRIVEGAQRKYGAEQDREFPEMLIYNLCLIDFDETGIRNEESVKAQLIAGVKRLEGAGADFIVIPCNTVHRFLDEMQDAITTPILSIIDTTRDAAKENDRKRVGILSSRSTRETQLYEQALETVGIAFLSATAEEQDQIDAVIGKVISGSHNGTDMATLAGISRRYVDEGAEAVILGCTELPLAISQADTDIPLYDSTGLLALASLRAAYGK